ncbi:MAG: hypothetical protein H7144_12750 [Burkholderiales bacterium]|nr:hypothetical protein [Phycisphaerae bacterium]
MVSVALMVVLMLAVTQIFSIAGKTMGGGQAIAAALRDAQAAQTVFAQDFASIAPDGACLIIRNSRKAAYRNASDLAIADMSGDPMKFDLDDDTNFETFSKLEYNFRNHRQDYLMFFARDQYSRQTGGNLTATDADDPLVADMSSREAAIFYHHLSLRHNNGTFVRTDVGGGGLPTYPGDGTPEGNPNNYFASQWTLGRVAMTLVAPTAGFIKDRNGVNQDSYDGTSIFRRFGLSNSTPRRDFDEARFDLAGTTITDYKKVLADYIKSSANSTTPWWYEPHMMNPRFQASPFVPQPVTADGAAAVTPIFIPACTQFMVEFAGDFVQQEWDPDENGTPDQASDMIFTPGSRNPSSTPPNKFYGQVTGNVADARIDSVAGTNQIRWYGLPRDTNGDGKIIGVDGDVVPLRDVLGALQSFEKVAPRSAATGPYTTPVLLTTNYMANTDPAPGYIVAWGPSDTNRPKMIRITLGIDRPEAEGKLPDGQSFEYVFSLGY